MICKNTWARDKATPMHWKTTVYNFQDLNKRLLNMGLTVSRAVSGPRRSCRFRCISATSTISAENRDHCKLDWGGAPNHRVLGQFGVKSSWLQRNEDHWNDQPPEQNGYRERFSVTSLLGQHVEGIQRAGNSIHTSACEGSRKLPTRRSPHRTLRRPKAQCMACKVLQIVSLDNNILLRSFHIVTKYQIWASKENSFVLNRVGDWFWYSLHHSAKNGKQRSWYA